MASYAECAIPAVPSWIVRQTSTLPINHAVSPGEEADRMEVPSVLASLMSLGWLPACVFGLCSWPFDAKRCPR